MTKKLKLTLVVPNYRWVQQEKYTYWTYVPYGVCLLAAMVEDICQVEIIDAYFRNMSTDELASALRESNPDVVGVTCIMDQFSSTGHTVAELAKLIKPSVTTIYGGVYVTMNPDVAIKDENVDYLVIGEGEYVLRDIIRYFLKESPLPNKGICYRLKGEVINTGRADFIEDLDVLPLPAYHLIPFESYSTVPPREKCIGQPPKMPYMRMLTSRGCPFGCSFCQIESITGHKFRPKSAKGVLKEIAWLRKKHNIQSLIFADDNFLVDKKRVREILQGMIEQNLVMPWIAEDAAVWPLDEDLLKLMQKAGCKYIDIAVESGTERVLKEIVQGKPIDLERVPKIASICRDLGIYIAANFIIGFPTETWDEIRKTLAYAESINVDYVRIFTAVPLRNTKLWDMTVRENAFKAGYDHFHATSSWSSGQIETKDFSPDDLTLLRAYEWDRINFTSPEKRKKTAEVINITEEELLNMRRETLRSALRKISMDYDKKNNPCDAIENIKSEK